MLLTLCGETRAALRARREASSRAQPRLGVSVWDRPARMLPTAPQQVCDTLSLSACPHARPSPGQGPGGTEGARSQSRLLSRAVLLTSFLPFCFDFLEVILTKTMLSCEIASQYSRQTQTLTDKKQPQTPQSHHQGQNRPHSHSVAVSWAAPSTRCPPAPGAWLLAVMSSSPGVARGTGGGLSRHGGCQATCLLPHGATTKLPAPWGHKSLLGCFSPGQ